MEDYNAENGLQESAQQGSGAPVEYGYDAVGTLVYLRQLVSGLQGASGYGIQYTYAHDRLTQITHNGITNTPTPTPRRGRSGACSMRTATA